MLHCLYGGKAPFADQQADERGKVADAAYPSGMPCRLRYGACPFAGEVAGFLNPMGEGISAGMENGYCTACAIMEHFDNPSMAYETYRQSMENLKSYMQSQQKQGRKKQK